MKKEDVIAQFTQHLRGADAEKANKDAEALRQANDQAREWNRLILQFDETIKPKLQSAEMHFLQREPTASIIGLFDLASQTISQRESKKPTITKRTDYFIDPIGRVAEDMQLKIEDKEKFARFIEGQTVETIGSPRVLGNRSIEDLVQGVEIEYTGPDNIRFTTWINGPTDPDSPFTLHWRMGDYDSSSTRINLDDLAIVSLSKELATRISNGKYKFTPQQEYNWGGPYS